MPETNHIFIAFPVNRNMDKQKSTLLEAYVKKAIALSKLRLIETFQNKETAGAAVGTLDALDVVYTEVGKFIDYADGKVSFFVPYYETVSAGHFCVIISLSISFYFI